MRATIEDADALRQVYRPAAPPAIAKDIGHLDRHCRSFIALSPFLCIGTVGATGMADVSPRGGEPGFVHVIDSKTLAIPDRPGNNRLDSFENIIATGSVGLLFFIPGVNEMLRVNGVGRIVVEPSLIERFTVGEKAPKSVRVVEVKEAYLHCAKALMRSDLWNPERLLPRTALASAGEIFADHCQIKASAELIDAALEAEAKANLY